VLSALLEQNQASVDTIKDGAATTLAHRLSQPGTGPAFSKFSLDVVKMTDLAQDPGRSHLCFALQERFVELASRMRPATRQFNAFVFASVGSIHVNAG
jgi:hypothetical protein